MVSIFNSVQKRERVWKEGEDDGERKSGGGASARVVVERKMEESEYERDERNREV